MWREAAKGICKAKRNNSLTVVSRDREKKKSHTKSRCLYNNTTISCHFRMNRQFALHTQEPQNNTVFKAECQVEVL